MELNKPTIYKFDEHIIKMDKVTKHDILEFNWILWFEHTWNTDGSDGITFTGVTPFDFGK